MKAPPGAMNHQPPGGGASSNSTPERRLLQRIGERMVQTGNSALPGRRQRMLNLILKAAGLLFVGLGLAGVLLPLLPTTPFLLLAAGCFARSSPAFHDWLLSHRLFGPYIRDWDRDRSIPLSAKVTAVTMMAASLTWMALASNAPAIAVWMAGAIMLCVAAWLVTRPTSRR